MNVFVTSRSKEYNLNKWSKWFCKFASFVWAKQKKKAISGGNSNCMISSPKNSFQLTLQVFRNIARTEKMNYCFGILIAKINFFWFKFSEYKNVCHLSKVHCFKSYTENIVSEDTLSLGKGFNVIKALKQYTDL